MKKPKLWTFQEILLFHKRSTAILLPLVIFKKFKIFSEKKCIFFYLKKPKFRANWEVSRILRRICYLWRFLKNFFFREEPIVFFKKPKLWTFCSILLVQAHSMAGFLPVEIFEKL